MGERLTWDEICEKYPNQWVGLTDAEFKEDECVNVKTAIVKYGDLDKDALLWKYIVDREPIVVIPTTRY